MDPAAVVLDIKRALDGLEPIEAGASIGDLDPAALDALGDRVAALGEMAEAEIARSLIAARLHRALAPALFDDDPRRRIALLERAAALYPRGALTQILRRLVRDRDSRVKARARQLLWRDRRFDDVALPDYRFRPNSGGGPYPLGDFNPSGWSAGLLRDARMGSRYNLRDRLVDRPPSPEREADRGRTRPVSSSDALAELLDVDGDQIRRFLRPGAGVGSAYVEFEVAKKSGGTRTLAAPRAALKAIQRRVLELFLAPLPVHPACHAYVRGRSLLTNTAPHRGAALVVKTDLRDFFPTINERRVFGLFRFYGYQPDVARLLSRLTTYRRTGDDGEAITPGVLPQGAPTSPAIANLVCRQLDARLDGLARRCGGRYTRYADDLTFSFDADPAAGLGRLFWWVDQICAQEGFVERADKRRVLRPHQRQLVTGVVVNQDQRVPRAARRRFRALLHHLESRGVDERGQSAGELRAYVLGFASWLQMVEPDKSTALVARARALYGR